MTIILSFNKQERDEPETVMDMKRAYVEYENRRVQLQIHFGELLSYDSETRFLIRSDLYEAQNLI